ncbi:MAG: ATP-binding cassette domain-containing protein, partial [Gammaproteobacteria bacterium]
DQANRYSNTWLSVSKFVRMALQLLMLGSGAFLVVANQITPGVMIAGSILLARALAPVEQSIGVWKQLLGVRQAYQQLQTYFAYPSIAVADIQLPTPKGHLQVENASYLPAGNKHPILQNISLQIQPGKLVALIGPSAAGKTTLARLIVGAYPCSEGCVRLDGANIFTWDRSDLGRHIGYLPQDIELFNSSVKHNIARNRAYGGYR